MTHKELLQSRIDSMQALVTSQEERYNATTRCLSQTKAALAIDDVVAKVNGRKLTYEELEFQHHWAGSQCLPSGWVRLLRYRLVLSISCQTQSSFHCFGWQTSCVVNHTPNMAINLAPFCRSVTSTLTI